MNENQERLLDALAAINNSILTLENAQNIIENMSKKEVQQVVDKFSEIYIEFDEKDLHDDAYNFEGYANHIITGIVEKLNLELD